jgi:crotonobetainyl-CoA:carnitine CoA-transferase CaiB-like acyl-CoA transferase
MLGEHTDQVLSDWLGLNAPAVAELKSEGVV